MINKIKTLLVIVIIALCTFYITSIKSVNAQATKLSAGKEITISNLTGNLNNINIKIEFTTNVNLDGTNNALLIGLVASDNTLLTDARFVVSKANTGVYDENGVSLNFQNAPLTIGKKTTSGSNYTYTIETRDFNIVNGTKNINKLVIAGQKGTEINSEVTFTEIKYSVTFGSNEPVYYSYNALISAPAKSYTFDINGHQEISNWTGNDSTSFVSGTTRALKDITYTGTGGTKANHTWTNVAEVKSSRGVDGVKAHQECSVCGAKRLSSSSTKLATSEDLKSVHTCNYTVSFNWTNAKNPGDKPVITYTCSCGYSYVIESKDITMTEKAGTVNPTYTAEGSITYTASCTYENKNASEDKTYTLPKLEHTLVHHNAVNPTCTTDGNIEYWSCSDCKKNFSDKYGLNEVTSIVVTKHHTLTKVDAKAETCTTDGNIEYYECSVCHEYFSDTEGKTQITNVTVTKHHTLVKVNETDTTVVHYNCTVCHKNYSDSNGTKEITDINKPVDDSHILTRYEAKAATCTTDGNIEYYTCSHCNKMFSDIYAQNEITDYIIPKGHNLLKYPSKKASCEKDGSLEYFGCSICNKKYSDIDALNELTDVVVKATGHSYDSNGRCTVCGKTNPNAQTTNKGCFSSITISGIIYLVSLTALLYKKKKEIK